jgi:hypothetical protein
MERYVSFSKDGGQNCMPSYGQYVMHNMQLYSLPIKMLHLSILLRASIINANSIQLGLLLFHVFLHASATSMTDEQPKFSIFSITSLFFFSKRVFL